MFYGYKFNKEDGNLFWYESTSRELIENEGAQEIDTNNILLIRKMIEVPDLNFIDHYEDNEKEKELFYAEHLPEDCHGDALGIDDDYFYMLSVYSSSNNSEPDGIKTVDGIEIYARCNDEEVLRAAGFEERVVDSTPDPAKYSVVELTL